MSVIMICISFNQFTDVLSASEGKGARRINYSTTLKNTAAYQGIATGIGGGLSESRESHLFNPHATPTTPSSANATPSLSISPSNNSHNTASCRTSGIEHCLEGANTNNNNIHSSNNSILWVTALKSCLWPCLPLNLSSTYHGCWYLFETRAFSLLLTSNDFFFILTKLFLSFRSKQLFNHKWPNDVAIKVAFSFMRSLEYLVSAFPCLLRPSQLRVNTLGLSWPNQLWIGTMLMRPTLRWLQLPSCWVCKLTSSLQVTRPPGEWANHQRTPSHFSPSIMLSFIRSNWNQSSQRSHR